MALSIARIGREKNLRKLAQNLYVIKRGDRAAIRRAVAALRRANPALADPAGFEPGAIILVPTDIGLTVTDRVESRDGANVRGLLQELAQRLEIGATFARGAFAASTRASKENLERLRNVEFLEAIKREAPDSEALVAEAMRALQGRTKANRLREERLSRAIEEATSQIDRLRRLAGDD